MVEMHRIEITTTMDRPHITHDILTVFRKYDISIIWMEVYTFVIYIKFLKVDMALWEKMNEEISKIYAVKDITVIDLIAVEERDIEMKSVLNTVSQGIVVLNKGGEIKYINKYAAQDVFSIAIPHANNQSVMKYIKDKKVQQFITKSSITDSIVNMEVQIGQKTYLLNINPVVSEESIFCGHIITIQDIKGIGELINRKRYDNPITFDDIIAKDEKMLEVVNHAKLFSPSDSPILITGESGTGKELFARAIHNLSRRSNKIFIAINCAAIPDQLLESELFGYEGGSFTGGKKNGKAGIFEVANGGTIFLDEIGEMAPHLQAKLLRVLQEGSIRRIGGHKEIPIDVRLLSATNQDIEKMVKNKQFRLDLLYRINIFNLQIPPIRQRRRDLEVLIDYFINTYEKKYNKEALELEPRAMDKLAHHSWPGNVRELQNVIERAVALSKESKITAEDIYLNHLLEDETLSQGVSLKEKLEEMEKNIIIRELKGQKSIRQTAKILGVTHTLLINRMKKYNIKV